MPVLPLEPFVYPGGLFTSQEQPVGDASSWWVLHVRPRTEKALARTLLESGTGFFLPLARRTSPSRGKTLTSYVPLFSGYVFLCGDNDARVRALTTNRVVRCLPVQNQEELRADLARVYHLMAAGAPLTPIERLLPGTRIEITSGPFAGIEGKIIRRGKRLTFFVEVRFLQQGVSLEIEGWMIEPVTHRRPDDGVPA